MKNKRSKIITIFLLITALNLLFNFTGESSQFPVDPNDPTSGGGGVQATVTFTAVCLQGPLGSFLNIRFCQGGPRECTGLYGDKHDGTCGIGNWSGCWVNCYGSYGQWAGSSDECRE